jgi:WXXGXW repeat (2 copies)
MNRGLKRILAPCLAAAMMVGSLAGCLVAPAPPPPDVVVQPVPPPDVVEVRPPAPGPGFIWVGGFHYWNGRRYVWRRGYWQRRPYGYHVWIRDHYVHGPHGFVYVRGHWG